MTGTANGDSPAGDPHSFTADKGYGQDTLLVHAGLPTHRSEGAAVLPIYQTATFGYHGILGGRPQGEYECWYTRPANNPNHMVLAAKIAELEGTESAVVLASGIAGVAATMMSLLNPGDHFLTQGQLYGCTYAVFHEELSRLGVEFSVVDTSKPGSWSAALRPNTKVFYVEGMSNPRLEVGDLRAVTAFAREHGLSSVVDASFTPPGKPLIWVGKTAANGSGCSWQSRVQICWQICSAG